MGYSKYTKDQVIKFVADHGDDVIAAITDKGLYFATVIGQLTVESKFGASAPGNNYGGIKASSTPFSSGIQMLDTTEEINGNDIRVKAAFATYTDFKKFMADYVYVLGLPSYISAGVYKATNAKDQLLAIAQGGYATRDPGVYLYNASGRIEACQDNFPWGKVSAAVAAPTAQVAATVGNPDNNSFSVGVSVAWQTIKSSLGF
jgi:hypothetical protein